MVPDAISYLTPPYYSHALSQQTAASAASSDEGLAQWERQQEERRRLSSPADKWVQGADLVGRAA